MLGGIEDTTGLKCMVCVLKQLPIGFIRKNVLSCSIVSNSLLPDCSPLGCSVRGILQARILEWVPIPSSRGSSQSRG